MPLGTFRKTWRQQLVVVVWGLAALQWLSDNFWRSVHAWIGSSAGWKTRRPIPTSLNWNLKHRQQSLLFNSLTSNPSETTTQDYSMDCCSLASDFVIVILHDCGQWKLVPVANVVATEDTKSMYQSEGAQAKRALELGFMYHKEASSHNNNNEVVFSAEWKETDLHIHMEGGIKNDNNPALWEVLQNLFVQWAYRQRSVSKSNNVTIVFANDDDDDKQTLSIDSDAHKTDIAFRSLFANLVDINTVEWVEMVTGSGKEVLGQVPRPLVHQFNLLHRGIGAFVTKDRPILLRQQQGNGVSLVEQPDFYVHQRVATKRVFPSLYDMFVGGVSVVGEPPALTAQREVAEELGLQNALQQTSWTDHPLLTCVVCTAYNRCVVTLYSYTMNSTRESITWQTEEVGWGDFVSYSQVVQEADASIQRLAQRNEWPGTHPPIQSNSNVVVQQQLSLQDWDFVPDGLLVWEAWLKYCR